MSMTRTIPLDCIVYADDLESSGVVIQALFEFKYPSGARLGDMIESPEGWIRRAAARYIEERENVCRV